jgi:hypothetical protein
MATQTRAIRNQLGADDGHLAWSVDSQPYLPPLQADDGDADVITDEESFHELPGQHEHFSHPQFMGNVLKTSGRPPVLGGQWPSISNLDHVCEKVGRFAWIRPTLRAGRRVGIEREPAAALPPFWLDQVNRTGSRGENPA